MAKQPYIPLYTGDYLQDTRTLPLAVRGAWVDLMIFMWRSRERGVLIGTIQEFAQMMSCTKDEANFAIGLLKQKEVCDFEILPGDLIKLICRRMHREAKTASERSKAGKAGAKVRFAKANDEANAKAKTKQNTDIDIDIDNAIDIEIGIKERVQGKPCNTIDFILDNALDEIYLDQEQPKWSHLDFKFELETFRNKVRGSPEEYSNRDRSGIRQAFQYQLRNSKGKPKNGTSKDKSTVHVGNLMEGVKRRYGGATG
jgi:uncharacterized protein YdaU (DUF1376 family)